MAAHTTHGETPRIVAQLGVLLLACAVWIAPTPVRGQGRVIPGPSYFNALEELFRADYRQAQRGLRSEARGAVQSLNARWVDSICYRTMLGETLYQQGQHAAALEQFDRSMELLLANDRWLMRVKFQQTPRPNANILRRLPPWARTGRPAVYADMPRSFLVSVGQVDNSAAAQQGGVIRQAQFWKLDAQEVARTIAWGIYRRGQLLGPLAPHDPLLSAVTDRLSRGGMSPPGHWSAAWVELWWGLAAASKGDAPAAAPHLDRAVRLDGQLTHALSGMALLARGEMALKSGDLATATPALNGAVSVATAYEDLAVLAEATRLLHAASVTDASPGPPLAAIADWANRLGWRHVSLDARLAIIERAMLAGDPGAAADLPRLFQRERDAEAGLLGLEALRLRALAAAPGKRQQATELARQAIAAQSRLSLRRFQTALTAVRVDEGSLSPRLARGVLVQLLGEPTPVDWAAAPLDTLAALADPQQEILERWFDIVTTRREPLDALAVVDLGLRRRFFATQPIAGRTAAMRRLLEAPDGTLSENDLLARSRLFQRLPGYAETRRESRRIAQKLRETNVLAGVTPESRKLAKEFRELISLQERRVLEGALGRIATPMVFPPAFDPVAAKQRLADGEALVVFHSTRGELHGMLLVAGGEDAWRIGKTSRVAAEVEGLLAQVAGVSPQQNWTREELDDDAWREKSAALGELLLGGSRLDLSQVQRLVIVPDGPLWRLPFEALLVGSPGEKQLPLGEIAPIRYAPTPGWALRERAPQTAEPVTAIITTGRSGDEEDLVADPIVDSAGATPLPTPITVDLATLKAASDRLVIDATQTIDPKRPYDLQLLPGGRRGAGALGEWVDLPQGGARCVALLGLNGGEAGGRAGRRSKAIGMKGDEVFHALCGLLAGGTETTLLSRWTTGGQRSRDLVAEFLIGQGDQPAADAWRRSVTLARGTPLDASREPRLDLGKAPDREPPGAGHPFWWAGYLLVD